MKFLVILLLAATVCYGAEEKKQEKRGLLGLGYGGLGYGGHGYASGLGYSGLGYGHALPATIGHALPAAYTHALPATYGLGYSGYSSGLGYGHGLQGYGYSGLGYSGLGYSGLGYGGYSGYLGHGLSGGLIAKAAPIAYSSPWIGSGHGYLH